MGWNKNKSLSFSLSYKKIKIWIKTISSWIVRKGSKKMRLFSFYKRVEKLFYHIFVFEGQMKTKSIWSCTIWWYGSCSLEESYWHFNLCCLMSKIVKMFVSIWYWQRIWCSQLMFYIKVGLVIFLWSSTVFTAFFQFLFAKTHHLQTLHRFYNF